MKKIAITVIKFIGFFLGWTILTSLLPLSSSEEPVTWRLWAEITPLLGIIAFTFIFWLIEKKSVKLHLFDNPMKGTALGVIAVTTILFTALHGGAFEAGIIPVLNVFTMSLLMTAVLEYSGSVIAPTIMHFLWNGIGALVLGGVSLADDYPNLLITTFTGNEILSGGVCKIEGSIIVLFVNVIMIAFFIFLKNKEQSRDYAVGVNK